MTPLNINVHPRLSLIASEKGIAIGPQGLSAYEVAVKNGFSGTEQEWLNSLHEYDHDHDVGDLVQLFQNSLL